VPANYEEEKKAASSARLETGNPPASIDWRAKGAVTGIKN